MATRNNAARTLSIPFSGTNLRRTSSPGTYQFATKTGPGHSRLPFLGGPRNGLGGYQWQSPPSRLPGTNSCLMSDSAILRQSKARDSNFKLGRYSSGRLSRNARTTSAEERTGTTRSCSWNRAAIGKSLAIMSPNWLLNIRSCPC